MVKTTEDECRDHFARRLVIRASGNRSISERLVTTSFIIVADELSEESSEVSFAENDNVVEELASKRAVDALDETVLPGRLWCRLDRFNAENLYAIVKPRTEDFVSIMNQKSRFGSVTRKRLEHLAQCPGGRWVRRDVEVDDSPAVVTQDQETVQKLEECGRDDDEIAGGSDLHVVSQEGHPSLTESSAPRAYTVLVDGGLGDLVSEEFEFQLNPGCAPERILPGQPFDQLNESGIDRGPAGLLPGTPTPVPPKASTMPADNSVRLDDEQHGLPPGPEPGERDPEETVTTAKPRTLALMFQDRQLLAERQVLQAECCRRHQP